MKTQAASARMSSYASGRERVDTSASRTLTQERVDAHFMAKSSFWDEIYKNCDVLGAVHRYRHALALSWVDQLALSHGTRVLEVGCGAGLAAVALARRGLRVEATDAVDAMVDRTRRRAARSAAGYNVHTSRADAHDLPFESESFGLVLALGVLPWLHSPSDAIREMARVLQPGGYLIASISNRARLTWLLDPLRSPPLDPLRTWTKSILRRIGRPWRRSTELHTNTVWARDFREMLARADLEAKVVTTFGFGPFTLFGRPILPEWLGLRLNRLLQRLADEHVPLLRRVGEQHIAQARKPPTH